MDTSKIISDYRDALMSVQKIEPFGKNVHDQVSDALSKVELVTNLICDKMHKDHKEENIRRMSNAHSYLMAMKYKKAISIIDSNLNLFYEDYLFLKEKAT